MKVGDVNKLLEGMALGLVDLSKKTSDGLSALHAGMHPFAEQTVEQFIAFLGQCDEYKKTGTVAGAKEKAAPKPNKTAMTVIDATAKVRGMLAEDNGGAVTSSRIGEMLVELNAGLNKAQWEELLTALDISGKPKTKQQAVEKLKQVLNSQVEMYVKAQSFHHNS